MELFRAVPLDRERGLLMELRTFRISRVPGGCTGPDIADGPHRLGVEEDPPAATANHEVVRVLELGYLPHGQLDSASLTDTALHPGYGNTALAR